MKKRLLAISMVVLVIIFAAMNLRETPLWAWAAMIGAVFVSLGLSMSMEADLPSPQSTAAAPHQAGVGARARIRQLIKHRYRAGPSV